MKHPYIKAALLLILTAFVTACVATSTMSVVNVAQPVLLGKVQRLHGKSSGPLGLKASFNFERQEKTADNWQRHIYAGSIADSEFVRLADSEDDRIVVEEIYVGSYSFLLASPAGSDQTSASWVGLSGGIYNGRAAENEQK